MVAQLGEAKYMGGQHSVQIKDVFVSITSKSMSLSSVLFMEILITIYLVYFYMPSSTEVQSLPELPEKDEVSLEISLGPFVQGPEETRMRHK